MKIKFIYIIITFFASVLFGQTKSKLFSNKVPLNLNTIECILISKPSANSAKPVYRQLDTKQCILFIKKINNAPPSGPYKYITKYGIDVCLLDGSKRTFRVNSNHIKENNDFTFDLGDKTFLDSLWKNAMLIK